MVRQWARDAYDSDASGLAVFLPVQSRPSALSFRGYWSGQVSDGVDADPRHEVRAQFDEGQDDLPHAEVARARSHRNDRRHADPLHRHRQTARPPHCQTAQLASGETARLIPVAALTPFSRTPLQPHTGRRCVWEAHFPFLPKRVVLSFIHRSPRRLKDYPT